MGLVYAVEVIANARPNGALHELQTWPKLCGHLPEDTRARPFDM